MKRVLFVAFIVLLMLSAFVSTLLADDEVLTCTTDSNDTSGLPTCFTPGDNECYEGGDMAGKCQGLTEQETTWLWKGGWWLARFNKGLVTREGVPQEFQILLPTPSDEPVAACMLDMTSEGWGMVPVPAAVLNADPSSIGAPWDEMGHFDGIFYWSWHNGWDLGLSKDSWEDVHVFSYSTWDEPPTSEWSYPTVGNCAVNLRNLPEPMDD